MMDALRSRPAIGAAIAYLLCWGIATLYLFARGADWVFPFVSLGIFGGALSGLAWFLTRKSDAPAVPVPRPGTELAAILLFLLAYAFIFLGWGLGALKAAVAEERAQEVAVLTAKLAVHIAIPVAILWALKAPLRPLFDTGLDRRGFWPTLIVMGAVLIGLLAVVSPSLANIAELEPTPAMLLWGVTGAFVWNALEAGLCEEFLFRAVLQSRLAAWFKSNAAAIVATSLLFGLAHAPGLYLRGGPGVDGWSTDPIQVAAFTIATLSPLSILFGVLWARTRSLLLVVLLHASVDVLPFTSEFISIWR
jgi:membrane protease YdiL (CAAX protease family)